MRKIAAIGMAQVMVFTIFTAFFMVVPMNVAAPAPSYVEVSQPIQLSYASYYERGQSIVHDGTNYWLFFGRHDSFAGNYGSGNPDDSNYRIRYKKASSIAGLATAAALSVTGATNIYQGQTSCVYYGGEIWVFAADGSSNIKAWKTIGLTSWTTVVTGFSGSGAPHLWATVYNWDIFLVYNAPGNKLQVRTWEGSAWSDPEDASTNEGMPRFYEDSSGNLHMIWCSWGMPAYYIHTYDEIDGWDTTPNYAITGTPNLDCDPTLFQINGNGDYCLMFAPWVAPRQYIAAWTAPTLAGLETATSHMVTNGGYGTTLWVDMWPIAYHHGGTDYLFFTSERKNDGTAQTGNIWYTEINWDTYDEHYTFIQNGVDAAANGGSVYVQEGDYKEQIVINKDLTLQGESGAKITAPDTRNMYIIPEISAMWDPIMIAFGGTEIGGFISGSATISVSIDGFEIHGGNKAATGRYVGVLYRNVNPGTVSNMNIHHMFDSDGEGDGPRTFGILAYGNSDVTIESNEIRDFSQGGIGAQGDAGSMVDPSAIIQGNTIYGNGLETGSGWWAENGIQIEDGAGGSIIDNDVTNCRVNHPGWVSSGIMVYDAADNVKVLNNDVTLCDVGIDVTSHSHDLVDSNTVSGCTWDGIRLGPPADYVTVTNNTCYDNNYGITVYGANENLIQSNDLYENNYGILLEGDSHNNKILNNNIHHNNVNGISLATFNTNSPLGTQIHCNSIYENGGYGIHYYYILPPPSPIDATNNWWGDPSGPYHGTWWMHGSIQIGPHTEGLGDEVSDYVLYDDWKIGHHEVTVDVTPNSLNLQSKGNFMSLKITSVPDGYTMSDIKGDTVKIISSIPATLYDVTGQSFSAKFDRSDFEDWADPGEVNVLIMGQFSDGTWFYGYDTITAHS